MILRGGLPALSLLTLLLGAGCTPATSGDGGETIGNVCQPGKVEACPCVGGTEGVQACHDDGMGYGACECPMDSSTSSSTTNATGDGDATSSEASTGDGDGDASTTDSTTSGDGDGDGTTDPTTSGDGDGDGTTDPTTGGDGDGDGDGTTDPTTSGDGDGDGTTDPTTSGDGDGDGGGTTDPTTTGDGDGDGDGDSDDFSLTSSDFMEDGEISIEHTCDSASPQINPPLQWDAAPFVARHHLVLENMTTNELVWVIYDVAGDRTAIAAGEVTVGELPPNPIGGTKQPENINGEPRYAGPCPPPGVTHEFEFRMYKGLSLVLPNATLSSSMTEVLPWMEADSDASATLRFTYTGATN